jgi:hypothetical protein
MEVKPRLENLVPEIEAWQRRFMGYVQLLRFTGFGFQDLATKSSLDSPSPSPVERLNLRILRARIAEIQPDALQIQPLVLQWDGLQSIGQSSLKMLMMKDSQTQNSLLIECRSYPENANVELLKSAVSLVARILAAAGSEARTIHVLRAVGYVHLPHPTREFQMVLKYPPSMDSPRTLRDALMSGLPSINARLELCKPVATAAFYTHTSGFVQIDPSRGDPPFPGDWECTGPCRSSKDCFTALGIEAGRFN